MSLDGPSRLIIAEPLEAQKPREPSEPPEPDRGRERGEPVAQPEPARR